MKAKKIKITWKEFFKGVDYNIGMFEEIGFKNIYAIPRGGLILGVLLSHKLNIPMIYDKNKINNWTLIVDDISDTGKTLKKFIINKKMYWIFTWAFDAKTKVMPDFTYRRKTRNQWLIFPWETDSSSKYDNTKI